MSFGARRVTLVACAMGCVVALWGVVEFAGSGSFSSLLVAHNRDFAVAALAVTWSPFVVIAWLALALKPRWAYAGAAIAAAGFDVYVLSLIVRRVPDTGYTVGFSPLGVLGYAIPAGAALGLLVDWYVHKRRGAPS